jgi:hypothetical protein
MSKNKVLDSKENSSKDLDSLFETRTPTQKQIQQNKKSKSSYDNNLNSLPAEIIALNMKGKTVDYWKKVRENFIQLLSECESKDEQEAILSSYDSMREGMQFFSTPTPDGNEDYLEPWRKLINEASKLKSPRDNQ